VDLTNEDVADVLALLDSLPYDSLDLETSQFRLTLRRAPGGWTEESRVLAEPAVFAPAFGAGSGPAGSPGDSHHDGQPRTATGSVAEPTPAPAPVTAATGTIAGVADGLSAVTTPLPGTFYRAPRPGADPFVQVGDAVAPDTVVAIVETMKLMNPVHAGTTGRVARIALDNGDFAPLGTTLMLIEPA
jgi:acetyl-CoA carboxylase biotin carboxyl carrier protein